MDLSYFGYPARRNTVVLLGAGATRGASFVERFHTHKPPLDIDFFKQLRASGGLAHTAQVEKLLQFVMEEFGTLDTSMERFYTEATIHDDFLRVGKTRGRPSVKYRRALEHFRSVLPAVFGVTAGNLRNCRHHEALASLLTPNDAVISFNYDCVIDRALSRVAGRRWDPVRGYGYPIQSGAEEWMDHSERGRPPKGTIQLLKLHGSLNWDWRNGQLHLRENPYVARAKPEDLMIVPPLWQKTFDDPPYNEVWAAARSFLASTKALVVIGYSLPQSDLFTSALLRIDVQALDFVLLANPDESARSRIKAALGSAITSKTFAVELETLQDMADWLNRHND